MKTGMSDYKLIFSENDKDEIVYLEFKNNDLNIFNYPSKFKFNSDKTVFLKWLSFALINIEIISTTNNNVEHIEQNLTEKQRSYKFP